MFQIDDQVNRELVKSYRNVSSPKALPFIASHRCEHGNNGRNDVGISHLAAET